MEPIVRLRGEGQELQGPAGGPLTYKARASETGGALTAFENVIAPGDGPPLHTHDREGESWHVIDGSLRFKLGEAIMAAPTGTFVHVPPGTPHCFQNVGDEPARILVLFTPGGMEGFFDRFAEIPAGAFGPDDFVRLGAPVGMTVVGPPLALSDPI